MNVSAKTNILLAIDFVPGEPLRRISAAVDLAKDFVRDQADHVVVLHVREFSVGRLPLMMREHGGADGLRAVDEVVFGLRATGVCASGLIREADVTHVSRAILDAAAEFDARLIVVNSPRHRLSVGGVAGYLVHHAEIPVLIAAKLCLAPAVQVPAR
jgi:nucleotide-binding universal stress UspA family protein